MFCSLGEGWPCIRELFAAVALASLFIAHPVLAQDKQDEKQDEMQVMQTPDGQLYLMTKDAQGKPVLQPLEAVSGTKSSQGAAPPPPAPAAGAEQKSAAPVTVYVPKKPASQSAPPGTPSAEVGTPNVQNFTFTEGSNVKIIPGPNGVQIEVSPLPKEADPVKAPEAKQAATPAEAKPPAAQSKSLAVLPKTKPAAVPLGQSLWQNGGVGFSMFAKEYKINSELAQAQGVSDYAGALGLHLEYNIPKSSLYIGTGLNFIRYDDQRPFQVRTYRGFGRYSLEQSDAGAGSGYIELGQRFGLFGDRLYVNVKGGYEEVNYSERYIDRCRGCYKQDIDVEAGAYIGGGLGVRLLELTDGAGLYLDLSYHEYTDDEASFESVSSARLSWIF